MSQIIVMAPKRPNWITLSEGRLRYLLTQIFLRGEMSGQALEKDKHSIPADREIEALIADVKNNPERT